MKWGVVVFPGSNDDRDSLYALHDVIGHDAVALWHAESDLKGVDAVVLPGGFSYGDYLRCGAIARFSPVVASVIEHANCGAPVLGICNGFQVLCEAGLLPGALVRNKDLRFICRSERLRVETADTAFSCMYNAGETIEIPVKHGEGCYTADAATLRELEDGRRVVFRYADGAANGSSADIAGIANTAGNVVGLMPHPEHAVDAAVGSTDGRRIFESAAAWLASSRVGADASARA